MDFEDINQSTVSSMSDLIKISDGDDQVFNDKPNMNNLPPQVEIKLSDEKEKEFTRQVSSASTMSRISRAHSVKASSILKKEWKMITFISVLFVVMVTGVALIYHFYKLELYTLDIGKHIHFDEISRKVEVYNENKEKILEGSLGHNLPAGALPYNCYPDDDLTNWQANRTCVGWKNKAELRIEYMQTVQHMNCYKFSWNSLNEQYYPFDCFSLSDAFWYGGFMANKAPFHEQKIPRTPLFTSTRNGKTGIGSVVEPYWITSKSLSIYVEGDPPLLISVNDDKNNGQLCLMAQYTNTPYHNYDESLPQLNYTICSGSNILQVQKYSLSYYSPKGDRNPPEEKLFRQPIYSTWANFKNVIDEQIIMNYTNSLNQNNMMKGMVLLQEGWEIKHGDIQFDPSTFPNASGMVQQIRNLGFDVGITVTHMVAPDSDRFQQGISEKFLVMDAGNNAPGLVQYWQGIHTDKYYGGFTAAFDTAALDSICSSPDNITGLWLSREKQFFIGYISFEGAQSDVLPYHSTFKDKFSSPNQYTRAFSKFAECDVPWAPVQSVYKCQLCKSFIMLYDFNSTDNRTENGLKAVLPSVISLGLMGYPFIIPGAIGGSNYESSPSEKLYTRWMQLNTFFPVMHFSIPPDNYGTGTVSKARELLTLHNDFVVPEIIKVVSNASHNLDPIVRPMWWNFPNDSKCLSIQDQFMVGNCIMVAPILDEGHEKRDIYIPAGTWIDKNSQRTIKGALTLTAYDAYNIIPYFHLQNC